MPYTFNPFTGSFDNTPSVPDVEGAYLPLSGGTVTGNVSVEGNFEVGASLGSATMFISGVRVGINTETPNEELTVIGDISATGVIYAFEGNSAIWNEAYTNVSSNSAAYLSGVDLSFLSVSANWESTFNTVYSLSSSWEESADIIPTVINYLSTTNVLVSSLTVIDTLSTSGSFEAGTGASTFYVGANIVGINTQTPNTELTVVGSISASDQIYVAEHQVIKTNTTDFPGTSAVTKIIAVSALPVSQEANTLYILL